MKKIYSTLVLAMVCTLISSWSLQAQAEDEQFEATFVAEDEGIDSEIAEELQSRKVAQVEGEDEYADDDYGPAPADQAEAPSEPASDIASQPAEQDSGLFKRGMYNFLEECQMHSSPDASLADEGKIPVGKMLWVEHYDNNWNIVHKKTRNVYIQKSCSIAKASK